MQGDSFFISRLIARYLCDDLSIEEKNTLFEWVNASYNNQILFKKICDEENWKRYCTQSTLFDKSQAEAKLEEQIHKECRRNLFHKIYRYAALIAIPVLLVTGALYYYDITTTAKKNARMAILANQEMHIMPGSKKALLQLSDGTIINLIQKDVIKISEDDGTNIETQHEALQYKPAKGKSSRALRNSLTIPHGGEYSIVLSDGTVVHLNAMSKLKFPTHFSMTSRVVELEGEAYFDVKKNGSPFIIKTQGVQIRVLGTSFNVCAYKGKPVQTTLVRGSIEISTPMETTLLKPSQQATIDLKDKKIEIKSIDAVSATSWNTGRLYFKDERLQDIMTVLSRWYNINVSYEDKDIKDICFGCFVDRYKEIAPFLKLLENTGKVRVVQRGNNIRLYSCNH